MILPGKFGGEEEPWYTPEAIELIEKELDPNFIAYEWGAGASTIWIAKRVKKLYSMDNSEKWFKKVTDRLNELNMTNVELMLKDVDAGYTEQIKEFPDDHFDVVFVDGRERNMCVENARSKIKSGGQLIFDNSQRPRYTGALVLMRGWQERVRLYGKWGTTIWTKP